MCLTVKVLKSNYHNIECFWKTEVISILFESKHRAANSLTKHMILTNQLYHI